MRAIPQAAIDLVRDQEETHLFAYDDAFYPPKAALPGDQIQGTLTAGTGHTGLDVYVGMLVTPMTDQAWLLKDLETAATRLFDRIGDVIDALTDNQYAAMLDFVFNLGASPSWTIWKRLKAKQFDQVPLEIAKFVNSGGKKLQGLVNRRNAEISLWSQGEPGSEDVTPPSSVTRTSLTPPTPSDPVKPSRSKAIIAGVTGAVTGAPVLCDQITHAISQYAEHSRYVDHALGVLAAIAAASAAITITYSFINKRNARN